MNDGETTRVLITGIASSKDLITNTSWEVVTSMKEDIEISRNIDLFKEKVEMRYNEVDTLVPEMWEKYKPHLIIIVGVFNLEEYIQLETTAYKSGYQVTDEELRCPPNNQNGSDGPEVLTTDLNIDVVCREFNKSGGLRAVKSNYAGRYLSEYIYYSFLCHSRRTLLLDVPSTLPTEEIAQALERVLEILLGQIRH